MQLLISAADAEFIDPKGYQALMAQARKKLKRSKAKKKGKSVNELKWYIGYSEEIRGSGSFEDLISGKTRDEEAKHDALPLNERLDDLVARTHACLEANMPGASVYLQLDHVPGILKNELRERLTQEAEKQANEEERLSLLTPEEREAEVQDLLEQLQGPGFMVLKV